MLPLTGLTLMVADWLTAMLESRRIGLLHVWPQFVDLSKYSLELALFPLPVNTL